MPAGWPRPLTPSSLLVSWMAAGVTPTPGKKQQICQHRDEPPMPCAVRRLERGLTIPPSKIADSLGAALGTRLSVSVPSKYPSCVGEVSGDICVPGQATQEAGAGRGRGVNLKVGFQTRYLPSNGFWARYCGLATLFYFCVRYSFIFVHKRKKSGQAGKESKKR